MMLSSSVRAYVCAEPVDMRKQIDGLAQLVEPLFSADAFGGQVFVFMGRRWTLWRGEKALRKVGAGDAFWDRLRECGRQPIANSKGALPQSQSANEVETGRRST